MNHHTARENKDVIKRKEMFLLLLSETEGGKKKLWSGGGAIADVARLSTATSDIVLTGDSLLIVWCPTGSIMTCASKGGGGRYYTKKTS